MRNMPPLRLGLVTSLATRAGLHPFDLETHEARARRVLAKADDLEWAWRRRMADAPAANEDTAPGLDGPTVVHRFVHLVSVTRP